jgi:hypothetical protein
MDIASRSLLERVQSCAGRMRAETGEEPFLVYLGSADRSNAVAEIFQERGLAAHVSPRELFVMVEASPAASSTEQSCDRVTKWADQKPLRDKVTRYQQQARLVRA